MIFPDEDKYKLINPTRDLDTPSGVYIPAGITDAITELEKMLDAQLIRPLQNINFSLKLG
jgi:hypothetical protein